MQVLSRADWGLQPNPRKSGSGTLPVEVLEEWGLEETPSVVTNAQGGPRPWSGLPKRAAVLGFPSLSRGLMEVLVSLFCFLFFFFF